MSRASVRPQFDDSAAASQSITNLPAPPTTVAVVEGLATGAPGFTMDQGAAAGQAAALVADAEQRERITRVYRRTRIDTRHLAVDPLDPEFLEFSRRPATIRERMRLFRELAAPLAVDVARRALLDAATAPADIGLVVFATSTGFIAPGVDVEVVRQVGLAPSVGRVIVNFMGCAAAMNALRTASDYVRANPDNKALVVCLELSSVNAVFSGDVNEVITHSLFGDGCGATVVGARPVGHPLSPGSIVMRSTFSHLLDDAEDGIVLGVNADGITCELAEQLPLYIRHGVDAVVTGALAREGLDKSAVDLWAIHPGGPKILDESCRSLGLDPAVVAPSWEILAEYGNMLSVSLIFVLAKMIGAPATKPIELGVAFSFAPGVTVEGMIFDVVRE